MKYYGRSMRWAFRAIHREYTVVGPLRKIPDLDKRVKEWEAWEPGDGNELVERYRTAYHTRLVKEYVKDSKERNALFSR